MLHARLRRDRSVPGAGTVTLGRLPDGARLRLDGVEVVARHDGDGLVLDVPEGPAVDLVATS